MDVTLKTTSFGGYDKKAVENYIDEKTKRRPTIIPIIMET